MIDKDVANHQKQLLIEKKVLMARQAILTSNCDIFGFEMLYRGERFNINLPEQGLGATGELLSNLYTCIHDDQLTAGYPLFINVDKHFIESPSFYPNSSDRVILEILETVPPTPSILQKIRKLRRLGFEFALDDYAFEEGRELFLPLVSIVKIDVLLCPMEKIRQKLPLLKKYSVTLLAEKIEDHEMLAKCQSLGFTLFQGYYLERPERIHGVEVSSNQQVTLKLLSELTRPDIKVNEVSDLIVCDPRLAMKIMLLVNSSLFSFVRKIHDVKEAVVALGIESVKRWAMILLLVSESESPLEIFRILLARAKALELFAIEKNANNPGNYFTLGLFSGLDAILGIGMKQITQSIPIDNELTSALNENSGQMGSLLLAIKNIEASNEDVDIGAIENWLDLNYKYWEGLTWADKLMENITV